MINICRGVVSQEGQTFGYQRVERFIITVSALSVLCYNSWDITEDSDIEKLFHNVRARIGEHSKSASW